MKESKKPSLQVMSIFILAIIFFCIIRLLVGIKITKHHTMPGGTTYISVYEKLADGAPINILIVGDSIAAGTGASQGNSWASLLPSRIEENFGSTCNITNISMGGNTSIAGTARVKMLNDDIDYDLAIICYG